MKNNFFKSNNSDLQNSLSLNKLELILKNILYLTYRVDEIIKVLDTLKIDSNLIRQVDEFHESPAELDLD